MLIKMFSLNASIPANQFQQQLEQTTNLIIKRLEDQISHLEYLLQEADEKIAVLDERLQQTNLLVKQVESNETLASELIPGKTAMIDIIDTKGLPDEPIDQENSTYEVVNTDRRRLILTMADQGYNVTEIAKATGVGKGEVMLLLQLNKK